MDQQYMAQTLAERSGVTYEEAYKALEECGWDMLDAAIKLERKHDTDKNDDRGFSDFKISTDKLKRNEQSFDDWLKLIWHWLLWLINASVKNNFNVVRKGETIVEVPILALVTLFLLAFWVMFAVLIVGLFMNCRYCFSGPDFPKE